MRDVGNNDDFLLLFCRGNELSEGGEGDVLVVQIDECILVVFFLLLGAEEHMQWLCAVMGQGEDKLRALIGLDQCTF